MDSKWVSAIFAKFQARYGHKFVTAYPSPKLVKAAIAEWGLGLAGLSGADVKRGLDAWQEDWPPSLPEFIKECKPKTQIAAHRDFVFLPKPKPNKKLGAKAFAEMQKALC